MTFRDATLDDCPRLAELNRQLIRDEGHRNAMITPEFERRMRDWLAGEYRAVRLIVEALTANPRAIDFWRKVGYTDYALTLEIPPGI